MKSPFFILILFFWALTYGLGQSSDAVEQIINRLRTVTDCNELNQTIPNLTAQIAAVNQQADNIGDAAATADYKSKYVVPFERARDVAVARAKELNCDAGGGSSNSPQPGQPDPEIARQQAIQELASITTGILNKGFDNKLKKFENSNQLEENLNLEDHQDDKEEFLSDLLEKDDPDELEQDLESLLNDKKDLFKRYSCEDILETDVDPNFQFPNGFTNFPPKIGWDNMAEYIIKNGEPLFVSKHGSLVIRYLVIRAYPQFEDMGTALCQVDSFPESSYQYISPATNGLKQYFYRVFIVAKNYSKRNIDFGCANIVELKLNRKINFTILDCHKVLCNNLFPESNWGLSDEMYVILNRQAISNRDPRLPIGLLPPSSYYITFAGDWFSEEPTFKSWGLCDSITY